METFSITNRLQFLIERLEHAVDVTESAPEDPDKGYPYATGYARSAMEDTARLLRDLKDELGVPVR